MFILEQRLEGMADHIAAADDADQHMVPFNGNLFDLLFAEDSGDGFNIFFGMHGDDLLLGDSHYVQTQQLLRPFLEQIIIPDEHINLEKESTIRSSCLPI